jgi:uncharacterized protein YbjT (DUF2867 family)
MRTLLVTGATGFIGSRVLPLLAEPAMIAPAMRGCDAAMYLVHVMGSGPGYAARERAAAHAFAHAAAACDLRRIVYLGGVVSRGRRSLHLHSRWRRARSSDAAACPRSSCAPR